MAGRPDVFYQNVAGPRTVSVPKPVSRGSNNRVAVPQRYNAMLGCFEDASSDHRRVARPAAPPQLRGVRHLVRGHAPPVVQAARRQTGQFRTRGGLPPPRRPAPRHQQGPVVLRRPGGQLVITGGAEELVLQVPEDYAGNQLVLQDSSGREVVLRVQDEDVSSQRLVLQHSQGQQVVLQGGEGTQQVVLEDSEGMQQVVLQGSHTGQVVLQETQNGHQMVLQENQSGQQVVFQANQAPGGRQGVLESSGRDNRVLPQGHQNSRPVVLQENQRGHHVVLQEDQSGQHIVLQGDQIILQDSGASEVASQSSQGGGAALQTGAAGEPVVMQPTAGDAGQEVVLDADVGGEVVLQLPGSCAGQELVLEQEDGRQVVLQVPPDAAGPDGTVRLIQVTGPDGSVQYIASHTDDPGYSVTEAGSGEVQQLPVNAEPAAHLPDSGSVPVPDTGSVPDSGQGRSSVQHTVADQGKTVVQDTVGTQGKVALQDTAADQGKVALQDTDTDQEKVVLQDAVADQEKPEIQGTDGVTRALEAALNEGEQGSSEVGTDDTTATDVTTAGVTVDPTSGVTSDVTSKSAGSDVVSAKGAVLHREGDSVESNPTTASPTATENSAPPGNTETTNQPTASTEERLSNSVTGVDPDQNTGRTHPVINSDPATDTAPNTAPDTLTSSENPPEKPPKPPPHPPPNTTLPEPSQGADSGPNPPPDCPAESGQSGEDGRAGTVEEAMARLMGEDAEVKAVSTPLQHTPGTGTAASDPPDPPPEPPPADRAPAHAQRTETNPTHRAAGDQTGAGGDGSGKGGEGDAKSAAVALVTEAEMSTEVTAEDTTEATAEVRAEDTSEMTAESPPKSTVCSVCGESPRSSPLTPISSIVLPCVGGPDTPLAAALGRCLGVRRGQGAAAGVVCVPCTVLVSQGFAAGPLQMSARDHLRNIWALGRGGRLSGPGARSGDPDIVRTRPPARRSKSHRGRGRPSKSRSVHTDRALHKPTVDHTSYVKPAPKPPSEGATEEGQETPEGRTSEDQRSGASQEEEEREEDTAQGERDGEGSQVETQKKADVENTGKEDDDVTASSETKAEESPKDVPKSVSTSAAKPAAKSVPESSSDDEQEDAREEREDVRRPPEEEEGPVRRTTSGRRSRAPRAWSPDVDLTPKVRSGGGKSGRGRGKRPSTALHAATSAAKRTKPKAALIHTGNSPKKAPAKPVAVQKGVSASTEMIKKGESKSAKQQSGKKEGEEKGNAQKSGKMDENGDEKALKNADVDESGKEDSLNDKGKKDISADEKESNAVEKDDKQNDAAAMSLETNGNSEETICQLNETTEKETTAEREKSQTTKQSATTNRETPKDETKSTMNRIHNKSGSSDKQTAKKTTRNNKTPIKPTAREKDDQTPQKRNTKRAVIAKKTVTKEVVTKERITKGAVTRGVTKTAGREEEGWSRSLSRQKRPAVSRDDSAGRPGKRRRAEAGQVITRTSGRAGRHLRSTP